MTFYRKNFREVFSKSIDGIKEENFDNSFLECVGTSKKFAKVELCSFRSTTFIQCYFRGVTFFNCDFTAAKFVDCNFKEAKFISCTFRYATFRRTIVDSAEMIANLPREPNIKRDLLRSLRVDARELGSSEDESFYIRKEIAASEQFHWDAFWGVEEFYRKKYGKVERLRFIISWLASKISGMIWGNGERPLRIAFFCMVIVLLASLAIFMSGDNSISLLLSDENIRSLVWQSFRLSISEFLGIPYVTTPESVKVPFWVSVIVVSLRYLIIGLLVSVFFRVYSRR